MGSRVIRVGASERSGAEGRKRASRIIAEQPNATLRHVAREAGISLSTAHDVRKRMERGESPIPGGLLNESADQRTILAVLRRDPSLRFTQNGRVLLQWLGFCQVNPTEVARSIPEHCARSVANLARSCAETWTRVADELDRRQDQ